MIIKNNSFIVSTIEIYGKSPKEKILRTLDVLYSKREILIKIMLVKFKEDGQGEQTCNQCNICAPRLRKKNYQTTVMASIIMNQNIE